MFLYLIIYKNQKKDLRNRRKDTAKFFRKDFGSYCIWILVLEKYFDNNNNNNNSIESIIKNIPSEVGSRPKLFKIINTAVAKTYFIKERDKKDKRKFRLFPSQRTIKEFEEWAKIFKGL